MSSVKKDFLTYNDIPIEIWVYICELIDDNKNYLFVANKYFFLLLTLINKPTNVAKMLFEYGQLYFIKYVNYLKSIKSAIISDTNKFPKISIVSALCLSVHYGHLDVIKYLVGLGADLRSVNNKEVKCALRQVRVEINKRYSCGANIAFSYDYPTKYASKNGHLEIVKYLVSLGADIRSDDDYAIRYASCNCHFEVVKYLISIGANFRSNDDYAVRHASKNGQLETVKYLVSVGANIRSNDDYAVRRALKNSHLEVVNYLVSLGAKSINN